MRLSINNILLSCTLLVGLHGQAQTTASVTFWTSSDAICTTNPFFSIIPVFTDDGTYGSDKTYVYEYSPDGQEWEHLLTIGNPFSRWSRNMQEGWYRVSVAHKDKTDQPETFIVSEPQYIQRVEGACTPFRYPWQDEISDNVCPRGTLLFRDDFGGNDPSDPVTSQTPLTTMSPDYRQAWDVYSYVSSGRFVVAKHGWKNNWEAFNTTTNLYSQWFIQDDHTYPNDYSRGYLLEVDGRGGKDAFYTTTFPVCHELDLSFSVYVANVLEPGHRFTKPQVRFLIQDDLTGDTIWEQSSGAIDAAPADYLIHGYPTVQSAPWHLVGASFHVPNGVDMLRLSIFNDVNDGTGNDFAMDDIEVRLCKPEVTINGEQEICMDSSYVFKASVTADGGFKTPYNYLWQYAKDSLPFNSDEWINLQTDLDLSFSSVSLDDDGWYRLCVTSNGVDVTTERYCRAMSEPFHLIVRDCTPYPELQILAVDTVVCDTLMPFTWRDTLFTEPGSFSVLLKDKRGYDSLLTTYSLQTEVCCPNLHYTTRDTTVCDTLMPFTWHGKLFAEPATQTFTYRDERGCDTLQETWTLRTEVCCPDLHYTTRDTTVCDTLMPFTWHGKLFTEPATQTFTYRDERGCDTLQETWTLRIEVCCPDLHYTTRDTTVCDTLMPFTWHRKLFTEPATQTFTYRDERGCDTLQETWTLRTEVCCPDLLYATHDTIVCDTLMPFLWEGILFTGPMEQEQMEYSPRGCDSILHFYVLDTVHCERLWEIIVNKYNWQLLCDNIALQRFFPYRKATAFQWYKNEQAVFGATEDDYAEQNELRGVFQLRVTLDGEQNIWSNIIEIADTQEAELPVEVTIYDSQGAQVHEEQVTHGIYLYRYRQGENLWTEKRMIP